MKRHILILVTMLFALSVWAQQIKQQVISTAGGYNVSGGMSVSWTLGETIIPTFRNGDLIITHGFQQQLVLVTVVENIEASVIVTIYPNPSSDKINIHFEKPQDGEILLFLLDSQGRLVKTDRIEVAETNKQFDLQDLAAGVYYLRMSKGKHANVYKIIKL